jgi:ribose/xylose/arabinose/galactoside ABC-type transport system permease subunit
MGAALYIISESGRRLAAHGRVGYGVGTFIGILLPGVIHTYLTLDGSLTPWWIKIIIGVLLFGFIGMQMLLSSQFNPLKLIRMPRRAAA